MGGKSDIYLAYTIAFYPPMKYYLKTLVFFLFVSLAASWMNSAYAQESGNRIWNELQALHHRSVSFPLWEPLRELSPSQLASRFRVQLPCQYWEPDAAVLLSLSGSRPEQLSLKLKDPDQIEWTIQLVRQDVVGRESRILHPGQTEGDAFVGGLYYRGIVSGQPESVAALSFFADQVSGVISIPGRGNLVLGKAGVGSAQTEQDAPHVLYYDSDVSDKPEFQCGVPDELTESFRQEAYAAPDSLFDSRCKVIKIFLECDYRMYTDQGRNRNQVVNYVTGLFNVVKTLYYNEYVDIEISDIMVWNTQDPFLHTDLQSILFHYTNYRRTNFNGNLAQLVTTFPPQQQGGIAWLGTLCQGFNGQSGPNSFAYIYNSYNQLPNYSWSVEVMAHELGHNFGLPHTHACFWGPGRNSTLDNCQPPENNACAAG
ncbi:MAG TPA: M12 family metallo-peptidase, partial [Saprospiraceae bacterium]|nr:M12 family metallo-peptidase [Saprospiraceae bacterium]